MHTSIAGFEFSTRRCREKSGAKLALQFERFGGASVTTIILGFMPSMRTHGEGPLRFDWKACAGGAVDPRDKP
jgi:hypothetical protein